VAEAIKSVEGICQVSLEIAAEEVSRKKAAAESSRVFAEI
jgi:hypothetical protein